MELKRMTYLVVLFALLLGACAPKTLTPDEDGLVWKFETAGEIWSSAVQVNETLIFGSDDFNVYALDAYTGELAWQF